MIFIIDYKSDEGNQQGPRAVSSRRSESFSLILRWVDLLSHNHMYSGNDTTKRQVMELFHSKPNTGQEERREATLGKAQRATRSRTVYARALGLLGHGVDREVAWDGKTLHPSRQCLSYSCFCLISDSVIYLFNITLRLFTFSHLIPLTLTTSISLLSSKTHANSTIPFSCEKYEPLSKFYILKIVFNSMVKKKQE